MKETLKYLIRNDINQELDNLFLCSLKEYLKIKGKICPECNIKQGYPHKGWNNYYCIHAEKEINKKIKEKHVHQLVQKNTDKFRQKDIKRGKSPQKFAQSSK